MADKWTISVKGVLTWENQVVLLRNERDEWELPGGQLDATDVSLEAALTREFLEELRLDVQVGRLIDTWIYEPLVGRRVVIVTYVCTAKKPDQLVHSYEHQAVGLFAVGELQGVELPDGYRRSIEQAADSESNHSG